MRWHLARQTVSQSASDRQHTPTPTPNPNPTATISHLIQTGCRPQEEGNHVIKVLILVLHAGAEYRVGGERERERDLYVRNTHIRN